MHSIHKIELDWIAAFQGHGDLKTVMTWFSYLGSEAIAVVVPFVYFVISFRAGARLIMLLSVNFLWVNALKLAFHSPRPFWLDLRIKALGGSGGYGLPSGHTVNATVVWSSVAAALRRPWAWIGALVVILLVSISRVYLGVHFISDVVTGWAAGAAIYCLYGCLEPKLYVWLRSLTVCRQLALAVGATAVYGLIAAAIVFGLGDPSASKTYPVGARDPRWIFQTSGGFFGATTGLILARRWACFEIRTALWRRGAALGYTLAVAWLIHEVKKPWHLPSLHSFQFLADFFGGAAPYWGFLVVVPRLLINAGLLQEPKRKS